MAQNRECLRVERSQLINKKCCADKMLLPIQMIDAAGVMKLMLNGWAY